MLALLGVLLWLLFRKKDEGFSIDGFKEPPEDQSGGEDVGGGGSFDGGGASDSWFVPEIKMPPALVIPVDVPVSVGNDYEHSAINESQTFKKLPFSRFREMEEKFA